MIERIHNTKRIAEKVEKAKVGDRKKKAKSASRLSNTELMAVFTEMAKDLGYIK